MFCRLCVFCSAFSNISTIFCFPICYVSLQSSSNYVFSSFRSPRFIQSHVSDTVYVKQVGLTSGTTIELLFDSAVV